MEYCGAGSVSDIMRIINRPVSYHLCEYLKYSLLTHLMYVWSTAERGGDSDSVTVCSEGAGVSSFQEKDPQRHKGWQYPPESGGPCQTGRLWCGRTTNSELDESETVKCLAVGREDRILLFEITAS